jgi:hypothetical protein
VLPVKAAEPAASRRLIAGSRSCRNVPAAAICVALSKMTMILPYRDVSRLVRGLYDGTSICHRVRVGLNSNTNRQIRQHLELQLLEQASPKKSFLLRLETEYCTNRHP